MSEDFLNPDAPIAKHGGTLPHWEQGEVIQFVTFRLGDSLPKEKIQQWNFQREAWMNTWPPPWTPELEAEYHRRFSLKLERWLDEGSGSCLLKEPANREALSEAMMRFQNERVIHHSWVIMPNHVHLLFKPIEPMAKLVQAWKSVSARTIGRGEIWQPNYRDTLIRDRQHFANAVRYIRKNPLKAGLKTGTFSIWESDRAKAVP